MPQLKSADRLCCVTADDMEDNQARALKRPRLVWTSKLHQCFVDAVEQLGLKNAVPKTIMQVCLCACQSGRLKHCLPIFPACCLREPGAKLCATGFEVPLRLSASVRGAMCCAATLLDSQQRHK